MSLSECPFLYDIMGKSLKISFSNGCCCIKYYLLIRISFRFGMGGIVLRRAGFVSLHCSVGGEPVSFLSLLRRCCK